MDHIGEWGGDPLRITLIGHSSGNPPYLALNPFHNLSFTLVSTYHYVGYDPYGRYIQP